MGTSSARSGQGANVPVRGSAPEKRGSETLARHGLLVLPRCEKVVRLSLEKRQLIVYLLLMASGFVLPYVVMWNTKALEPSTLREGEMRLVVRFINALRI